MADLVRVGVGDDYDVLVGRGIATFAVDLLADWVAKVLVVHAPTGRDLAALLAARIEAGGRTAYLHEVPDAEAAKTPIVAAQAWGVLGQAGFTRSDAVIGVGGGAVTDVAGFIAATWLRGVAVVQVPTSLVGMVDAAAVSYTHLDVYKRQPRGRPRADADLVRRLVR